MTGLIKAMKSYNLHCKKKNLEGANQAYFKCLVEGRKAAKLFKEVYGDVDYDEKLFDLWSIFEF